MKLVITKMYGTAMLCLLSLPLLMAQIPNTSPFPVDFSVSGESGFNREFTYSSMADFGTNITQTVVGELMWARDDGMFDPDGDGTFVDPDSLNCNWETTMEDIAGKVALVRRGACNFSQKIHNAQTAGAIGVIILNHTYDADGGGLVNMGLGDSVVNIVIPAIFLTRDNGDIILNRMATGETLTATFQVRAFSRPIGPQAYITPQSQIKPLTGISVNALNLDSENAIFFPSAKADVFDPSGGVTTLNAALDSIGAAGNGVFEFGDYTPDAVGEYTIEYTTSISDDTLTRTFFISDHTFQIDEGNLPIWPEDSWIIESDQAFLDGGLRYDFGNMFYTGASTGLAAFATFSIANPDSLFTGDPESDVFKLTLYDADPDGDGVGPVGDEQAYEDFGATIVAQTSYVLTGSEIPYEIITVPFDAPVPLKANGQYILMAEYDGVNSALGNPPYYSYSGTDAYPGITSVKFTDRLYLEGFGDLDNLTNDGYSTSFHAVVRLHMDGFTKTDDFKVLDTHKVSLMPNPTVDQVNLQFNLDNNADEVQIVMVTMQGQLLETIKLENVHNENYEFEVGHLPAGSYFFGILTPEGYKAEKFVVVK